MKCPAGKRLFKWKQFFPNFFLENILRIIFDLRREVCSKLPALFVRPSWDVVVHDPLWHLKHRSGIEGGLKNKWNVYIPETEDIIYPGPLRGGWVGVAFGALFQSALITPHGTISRKPSGGGGKNTGINFHQMESKYLIVPFMTSPYLSVYPVIGFHLWFSYTGTLLTSVCGCIWSASPAINKHDASKWTVIRSCSCELCACQVSTAATDGASTMLRQLQTKLQAVGKKCTESHLHV